MVRVAVRVEFKAERKQPLVDLIRRVASLFDSAGLQPDLQATFGDAPAAIRPTSAVARALKKYPHLAPLERNDAPRLSAALPAIRRLTNSGGSAAFALKDILALAEGVPRSLPFHAVSVNFGHADFGPAVFPENLSPPPGIGVGDGWWVNGRVRSVSAFYVVETDTDSKKLPGPPAPVGAILSGLGKPKTTAQFVAPEAIAPPDVTGNSTRQLPAREVTLVRPIVVKYQRGMKSLLERIGLPCDLPPASDVWQEHLGATGPLKPALVAAFRPRGYDCRGDSGTFTLRRRTPANHIVEVELDVGTWSRSLTFMFHVLGPRFTATVTPPVTPRDGARQYPIGDTAHWERIVANIAAIVDELDRTFVMEIESVVDPAPEWFEPGR